jgi:hypothetical protein
MALHRLNLLDRIGEERDHKLSTFLGGLRPNTLRSLNIISDCGIGAETLLSLTAHQKSLKELKLFFRTECLEHLPLLKDCTAIEILKLEDGDGNAMLESVAKDAFGTVVQWLKNCKNLRELDVVRLASAANLVPPVLLTNEIHLQRLYIFSEDYDGHESKDLHRALVQQPTLRSLSLTGYGNSMGRDDNETLVESLAKLTDLSELELRGISDMLNDAHINHLTTHLTKLEDLYVTGLRFTDDVLDEISNLKFLQSVTFAGITKFTMDGLLEYISKAGPGNRGINFQVVMADPEDHLSEDEQSYIRQQFATHLDGKFEYTLWRGMLAPSWHYKLALTNKSLEDPAESELELESD